MYYPECEALANEQSDLKTVIQKIDAKLYSDGNFGIIKPDIIASLINENIDEVSGVLQQLHEKGLLAQKKYIECPDPQCKNLMNFEDYMMAFKNQDSFECTQCQKDLVDNRPNKVKKYRLNSTKIRKSIPDPENDSKEANSMTDDFHQKLPQKILDDPFKNTPLLQYYSKKFDSLKSKPFENKRVFFVLHFLKDLIPFIKACERLGLNLKNSYFFYKKYPYPQREAIGKWLENQGAIVKPHSDIIQYIKQLADDPPERIGEILIIEDGGFFVPLIHKKFPDLITHVIGAVEQTTRGIFNTEELDELKFPVLSVATSKLKGDFEPDYVAEAVANNITRLLSNTSLSRKEVALFGYGTIGTKIHEWLNKKGSTTTISEPSEEKKLLIKGANIAKSPEEAAQNKKFIIGASGRQSINSNVISHLSHDTYLVSASSELYEIDIAELNKQARKEKELTNDDDLLIGTTYVLHPNREIHVLANGYPINFWGFDSMPDEASDLILSLILLSAVKLTSEKNSEPGIDSNAVNEIAEEHELAKKFREFHQQG